MSLGIFHSDAPSLSVPEAELRGGSWGGSCIILAPGQWSHAPFPFTSHARELVLPLNPGLGFRLWMQRLVPRPLVSRSSIWFLLCPNHKLFCSLSFPALCSLPPHFIPRGSRNSCPLSYLGGVAELSETNQSTHKNNSDTIEHRYLKRDFLTTPDFPNPYLPLTHWCASCGYP